MSHILRPLIDKIIQTTKYINFQKLYYCNYFKNLKKLQFSHQSKQLVIIVSYLHKVEFYF